ncbi:NAD(P)H-binding protein [Cohnella suwonensis]|uniref:NAD(P)H-binding protein n=1 Tax=Cohnella suwonensis TaxID=696072 RepID=A0ABW0LXA1_9BACL
MVSSSKTALVAGATGLIGKQLVRQLLDDPNYGRVIALSRKAIPADHPKLEVVAVSLETLAEVAPTLRADDWFCALGTTIKQAGSQEAFRRVDYEYPMALGRRAAASGASRFLLVSAAGASANSSIFYSRVKGELERDLGGLALPSLQIFRPSLLLGDREQIRRGEKLWSAVMKAVGPLLLGPLKRYRAIHGRTVAAAMIRAANGAGAGSGDATRAGSVSPDGKGTVLVRDGRWMAENGRL